MAQRENGKSCPPPPGPVSQRLAGVWQQRKTVTVLPYPVPDLGQVRPGTGHGIGSRLSELNSAQPPRPIFLPKLVGSQGLSVLHLPPLVTWVTPSVSLSKTNHLKRLLLLQTCRRHGQIFSSLSVRHPLSVIAKPTQPGTASAQAARGAPSACLDSGTMPTWGHVASPLNGTYCFKLVLQVHFLPSGNG